MRTTRVTPTGDQVLVLVLVTPYGPWHPVVRRLLGMLDEGRYSAALEASHHYERLIRAAADRHTLGYVLLMRAKALTELGRAGEALVVDNQLLDMYRAAGWTVGEIKALADSAQDLFSLGRVAEGLARLGRAVWLLERCPPRGERYISAVLSVSASAQLAEMYETASDTLVQLLADLSGELQPLVRDNPLQRYYIEDYYAELLLEWGVRLEHLGRNDEAVTRWTRSLGLLTNWRHLADFEPFSRAMLGLVLAKLGRHTEALDVAAAMIGEIRRGERYREARLCHLAAGVAQRGLGNLEAARRELMAAEQLWAYGGSAAERVLLQQELAALALAADLGDGRNPILRQALRAHAERLWDFRLQRLATLRQARQRAQIDAERAVVDQALLQDPLTALGNRRRFDQRLDSVGGSAPDAAEAPLALMLVDVDRFKTVNDVHSHPVGDQVLRGIAGVLRAHSRAADVAVRLGGDEFALFLHAAPAEAAMIAERIRSEVAAIDWGVLSAGLQVTISTGLATRAGDQTGAELFAAADAKLYEAKRGGRNQIAV